MSSWKIYPQYNFYFLTSTIVEWAPIFIELDFFSIITDSLKYCVQEKELNIHGYVIMLNHIHLLVSSNRNLSDIMRDFKSFTSKEMSSLLEEKNLKNPLQIFRQAAVLDNKSGYKVWQSGFHPKAVYSEKFYLQKLDYIHNNPVRKGFVVKPEHWFYSSARNYAGLDNYPLEVDIL